MRAEEEESDMANTIATSIGNALLERLFVRGTVTEAEAITPRMRRLRIHAPALSQLPYQPGQQVRVQVGALFGLEMVKGDMLRTYSVWQHSREQASLELCTLDHPGRGPGARWASGVSAGTAVSFRAPEGKFVVRRHTGLHLLLGDETASVALGAIARAVPSGGRVVGLLETESAHERLPMPTTSELSWVVRGARPTGDIGPLTDALRSVAPTLTPAAERTAYLAGEARAIKALRAILLEQGWSSRDILVKPFWMPGKKGLE